jgi:hypothetical protein
MVRIVLLASVLAVAVACGPVTGSRTPAQVLGNPIDDARAALARGDSLLLALEDASLEFPGMPEEFSPDSEKGYRMISARSLVVSRSEWAAQRDSLRVYAAAYNRLVSEAGSGSASGAR